MPSSTTRLVEATSKAIAAVKLAPLAEQRSGQRHGGVEHEEEAAPNPAAIASVFGRSSPSRRMMVERRTTACTTADRAKPRISAHKISRVIDPLIASLTGFLLANGYWAWALLTLAGAVANIVLAYRVSRTTMP
jgi:hypothetical protein